MADLALSNSNPLLLFSYFGDHLDTDLGWLWSHAWLSVLPVLIGLVLSLPLGYAARRYPWLYLPMVSVTGLLYTIPSIALFVALPEILGIQVLSPVNVLVALSIYSVALLVRVVADGLASVPDEVNQAALAMGYTRWQRLVRVELPIAVPVIAAGLRVAVVSNVSIVAIAGTIGIPNLGQLFTVGFQLSVYGPYYPPIALGIVLCVALALALDAVVVLTNRALTPLAAGGGGAMTSWSSVFTWLNDPLNWRGDFGIGHQILAHLGYVGLALAVSLVIGVTGGLLIGHSGRGRWLVAVANGLRALPTTGLLILFYVVIVARVSGDLAFLLPTEIVLVLLAVPPILANTYAGIDNVSPAVRDAARGMGMTSSQVLFRVELPNALPLMFSGLRSATLQVIATATIAAYVGLGGLGRFVYDGLAQNDFAQMIGGAIVVAVVALLADILLALMQRYLVSRGVSGRFRTKSGRRPTVAGEPDSRVAAVEKLEAATTS